MKPAFIIYPPQDRLLAVRLWDELRYNGLEVGIDLQDVPAHLDRLAVLEDLVSGCDFLLLMVSKHATHCPELRRLHLLAIEQDCDVVALLLPGGTLPKTLKSAKTLAFGNYERGLRHLKQLLPPNLLNPAPDEQRILANLRHENADVRRTTLYMVAKQGLHRAAPHVVTLMLTDDDSEVRAAAAWAIDKLNNVDNAPALLLALHDDSFSVRSNAGWGLVNMGRRKDAPASRALITELIDVLRDEHNRHDVREMAYMVLLRIGGKTAYDAIDRYWDKR